MELSCYDFVEGGAPVVLEVAPGLIRCLVRRKWLTLTPEELVRQALLDRLISNVGANALETLEVVVEGASLDIAIFPRPTDSLFRPDIPPLLVIETKRREIQVLDSPEHERQLLTYLRRTGGRDGVLANCEELWHYRRSSEGYAKAKLDNLAALVDLIRINGAEVQSMLQEHQRWFNKARVGDFDSFRRLVEFYGKSAESTIKFIYEERQQLNYATGFLFQISDEQIQCMPRGQAVQKKLAIFAKSFRRLHSITSLRQRT